jgi:hypothetical protein
MQHANGRSALSIVIERDPVVQLGHSDFAADRGQGKHAPAARPIQPMFPNDSAGRIAATLKVPEPEPWLPSLCPPAAVLSLRCREAEARLVNKTTDSTPAWMTILIAARLIMLSSLGTS